MTLPQWMLDEHRASKDPDAQVASPTAVEVKRGEAIFDGTDYPREWSGFVGQEEVIEQLMVRLASAKSRDARMDHTLLASGEYGIGKSTVATMLAYKAGVGLVRTKGPLDVWKARRLLAGMRDRDVLFIDEGHALVEGGKTKADWMLPFMTEGRLYTEDGVIEVPDVAVVVATTDAGKLPQTLLSRFMVRPTFVAYTPEQAAQIAENLAGRMHVPGLTAEQLRTIAVAANGNPRDMRAVLTAARDLIEAFPGRPVDLDKAIDWAGFSYDGLSMLAREVLVVLKAQKRFTASIDSIQGILGEPGPLRHDEQVLLKRGLVTISGRGRTLTEAGIRRAEQLRHELR